MRGKSFVNHHANNGRPKFNKWNNNNKWDVNKKSHFIMIPFEDVNFVHAYNGLCADITSYKPIDGFYPEMLQKPGKLHMTICVLDLGEDLDKINKVNDILLNLITPIKEITNSKLVFNFESYGTMGEKEKARVIYAKMIEDENFSKLCEIIHLIIEALVNAKILEETTLKDRHIAFHNGKYSITLHMTLLNISFLNKILKKRGEREFKNFNANPTLEYLKDKILPSAEINKINFCRMREDKLTQKYEVVYSYPI